MNLTNRWMNSATVLAQIGHAFGSYSIISTTAFLSYRYQWGWLPLIVITSLFITYCLLKEFWYDLKYEIDPVQTIWDSLLDFTFYVVGTSVAWIMIGFTLHGKL
jgi:hypothetical protein